jgi:NAD(P)-dependent dehydrogenase (short-subunit alcohol dehydrogenase family)
MITRRQFVQTATTATGGAYLAGALGLAGCSNESRKGDVSSTRVPALRETTSRPHHFDKYSTAEEVTAGLDLSGKTALLTGSNSGIGLETMRVLVLRGAHVYALARNKEKAQAACNAVSVPGAKGSATAFACEQTDYESVVTCTDAIRALGAPLDMLICNAGLNVPKLEQVNGIEKHFAVQHLSHFILVNRLLDNVKAAPQGRVVLVSSIMYKDAPHEGIEFDNLSGERGPYNWVRMYGQSKLANGLFARELARRLKNNGATANVLHPGNVEGTNIGHVWSDAIRPKHSAMYEWFEGEWWFMRHGGFFMKNVSQGAATTCYVATSPDLQTVSGAYFEDCHKVVPGRHMRDDVMAAKLWSVSEELTRPYLAAG